MAVLKGRTGVWGFLFLNDGVCFGYSTKIEKEKREHAKQHGMIRTEITGAEIAEEMEKERRLFQLQMCEVRTAWSQPRASDAAPLAFAAGQPSLCLNAGCGLMIRGGDCFSRTLISTFLQAFWDLPSPCCLIF